MKRFHNFILCRHFSYDRNNGCLAKISKLPFLKQVIRSACFHESVLYTLTIDDFVKSFVANRLLH